MKRNHENVNRVPPAPSNINGENRTVYIGYRPVGGAVSSWVFSSLGAVLGGGKLNMGRSYQPPFPGHHWCVVVGNFLHQLQATSLNKGWNYYDSDKIDVVGGNWALYEVGATSFNDVAISEAGVTAINSIPEQYDIYNNNCQTFTIALLDIICRAGRVKVFTSYSLTKRQIAYVPGAEQGVQGDAEGAVPEDGVKHVAILAKAQDIMDEHTPILTKEQEEEISLGPKVATE